MDQYGEGVVLWAAQSADELMDEGDMDGAAVAPDRGRDRRAAAGTAGRREAELTNLAPSLSGRHASGRGWRPGASPSPRHHRRRGR